MAAHRLIHPEGWSKAKGYSNGVLAEPGRTLYVAGQIGWDEEEKFGSDEFIPQFQKALENVVAVVEAANGEAGHICRLTIYVTDKSEYLADTQAVGQAYRNVMGKHFPAMALLEVQALVHPQAKVEIEATAVIPS